MNVWGGELSDFPIAEDNKVEVGQFSLRSTVSGNERVGPDIKALALSDGIVPCHGQAKGSPLL